MTFGSLFAGIGGFDLGLERAGRRCVGQVEADAACLRILDRHWPNTDRCEDVRICDATTFAARPELLCGGFPCQDLSVAGRRAGLAGERSGLFYEFMRVVGELAPRWVLIENVPGLLSSRGGRDMGAVLGTLAKLGYGTAYRVLDAQWFGVAQRRRRVFVVGCAGGDWRRAAEVLFEPESLPWDSPPRREAGAGVAKCVVAGSGGGGHRYDADTETLIPFDSTQVTSPDNRSRPENGDPCYTLPAAGHAPAVAYRTTGKHGCYETGDRVGALNCGTDRNQHVVAYQCHGSNVGPMGTIRAGNGNESGGVPFVLAERGRPEGRTLEYSQGPANALMTANGGRNGMGVGAVAGQQCGVRRLTPTECERLQGFPDGWTAGQSDTTRYRQLGNAVPPPVAEWIARRIATINP